MTELSQHQSAKPIWIANLMLLMVAIVWGTSYGVAKQALSYYSVLGLLAVRFCLTFIVLLPSLPAIRRPEGRDTLRAGIPLGVLLLCIFACETYGIAHTYAANAAFLISLCVVFTPFVEWIILRQRPETSAFVLTLVSLCGAFLLSFNMHGHFQLGDALMLVAAVLRALIVCLAKRLMRGRNVATLALTAVQAGIVGLGSLVAALVLLERGQLSLPSQLPFWICTLYMVLFCTIFAFFAQNYGLRRLSPTRVSLLMGSEPVFGAVFAWIYLGEKLSVVACLGGALIVAASLWATLPRSAAKNDKAYA